MSTGMWGGAPPTSQAGMFGNNTPGYGGAFNNNAPPPTTGLQNIFDNNSPYQPTGSSSNQYFGAMPGMPNPGTTSSIQPQSSGGGSPYNYLTQSVGSPNNPFSGQNYVGNQDPGEAKDLGHGIVATGLQYPGLSQNFVDMLNNQIGQGLTPFNQSTPLPTGGSTQPGQLTAGLNPLLQQLMQFFQTGQGGGTPGLSNLATIANNGVSALPEWQSMVQAMQQNIQQNQANLAEQFGSTGNLAGSGFANAMQNFQQGTTATQNALLGQLQQSNIQNIQMPAISELFSGSQTMAGGLQQLDQNAINSLLQQFQLDAPQNNPLLQDIMGMSTLYPPTTKTPTGLQTGISMIGALTGSGFSTGGGGSSPSTSVSF